jgi:hypothetical protein
MMRTNHLDKRRVRRYDETGFLLQFTDQLEVFAIILSNLAPAMVAHEEAYPAGKWANKTALRAIPR